MIVIFEGPDRIGKTTLSNKLSGVTNVPVLHSSQPKGDPLIEYTTLPEPHVILDRWHMGQVVYPTLYPEGRTALTPGQVRWIEMFLASRGAVLARVAHNLEDVRERVDNDPNSYLRPDDVATCAAMFDQLYASTLLPEYPLRYNDGLDELQALAVFAWSQWMQASSNRKIENVIGNVNYCELLLVGDQVGDKEKAEITLPFAPYPKGSGHYLMSTLGYLDEELQRNVVIVNAYEPDNRPTQLWNLWLQLDCPRVVALGRRADAALDRYDVPHGVVQHPQHVRRFWHRLSNRYAKAIESVSPGERMKVEDMHEV